MGRKLIGFWARILDLAFGDFELRQGRERIYSFGLFDRDLAQKPQPIFSPKSQNLFSTCC
jgi:hypothetical protein